MKQLWQRAATRIDALTLRERIIIFAMAALVLITLVNSLVLDPQYAKQKQLSERIKQEQALMTALRGEIQGKVLAQSEDPDKDNRAKLQQLKQEMAGLQRSLHDMQSGLVSPDRMPALLEDILRQNGSLRLVSLKTFPATPLSDAAAETGRSGTTGNFAEQAGASLREQNEGLPESGPRARGTAIVYKHGVEIVVQGSYFDMMHYLTQLEALPWQLFWNKAVFTVDEYPKSTMTLRVLTLSLDEKWLNL